MVYCEEAKIDSTELFTVINNDNNNNDNDNDNDNDNNNNNNNNFKIKLYLFHIMSKNTHIRNKISNSKTSSVLVQVDE